MSKSIKITLIAVISAIIIAAGTLTAVSAHINSPAYILSLAERYLEELNYEQAVIQLEKYLEIEPKNSEAWLALAEAYESMGDTEKVAEVLERAVEEADSNKAAEKLKEIRKSETTTVASTTAAPVTSEDTTTPPITTTTPPITTTSETTTVVTTQPVINEPEWLTDYTLSDEDMELIDSQFGHMSYCCGQKPSLFLEGELTEERAFGLAFSSIIGMIPYETFKRDGMVYDKRIQPELRDIYDPLEKFTFTNGYGETMMYSACGYDAAEVDKIIYDIFGVKATHKIDLEHFYYYDDYYYIPSQAAGGTACSEFVRYHLTNDGRFVVEIDYAENFADPDWNSYYILVSAHEEDGRVYFRYHAITDNIHDITSSVHIVKTFETTTTTTTTTVAVSIEPISSEEAERMLFDYWRNGIEPDMERLVMVEELVIGKNVRIDPFNPEKMLDYDWSILSKLTNLQTLDLSNCYLPDISFLKKLTNLKELNLTGHHFGYCSGRGCCISDISPLKNLTNLEKLYITFNSISDISPLKNLTKLKYLEARGNSISDISALKKLTNLEYICLNMNNVSDISPVKNLTKLKFLDLGSNKVTDISSLAKLVNIEELWLGLYDMHDFSVLKKLPKLKTLVIDGLYNTESEMKALEKMLPNCEVDY